MGQRLVLEHKDDTAKIAYDLGHLHWIRKALESCASSLSALSVLAALCAAKYLFGGL